MSFKDIWKRIEKDETDTVETSLFFCEPSTPSEKPELEKTHFTSRYYPERSSFDNLTQEDINKVFSHINAVKRKQFNGKSAFDLFAFYYSHELANAPGIEFIPSKYVVQSPALLK